MTIIVGLIAQFLHIGLLLAAAPALCGIMRWTGSRLAGHAGPPVMQPWRDMRRLLRKQPVVAEGASALSGLALPLHAAAVAVVACLVPSFTLGMAFAPVSDLVAIGALLALARVSLALVAMDAGTTSGGMAASRSMLLGCLADSALLLATFVLALLSGSSNLDLIAAMQLETGGAWRAGAVVALGATALLAWVASEPRPCLATELSGCELAVFEAAAALHVLVWFNLLGAAFLPYGMAAAGAGPMAWPPGLAAWLGRTLLFAIALVVLRAVVGRVRLWRSVRVLGVAVLFAALAAVLLFAGMGTA